jgi:UDP-GlcNAc:undecaprenyl-phosphate GlcNAc-1-phosphate transferase
VTFPFNAYLAAAVVAFSVSCISLPLWRSWCGRTGLVDDPGRRKIHDAPVPLAGGLAVITGLLVPLAIGVIFLSLGHRTSLQTQAAELKANALPLLRHGFNRRGLELTSILFGAILIWALGWLDDKHELRPAAKFAGQVVVAALVAASGARITLFVPNAAFSYLVTILWILTVINAFNFMDNMNGLCAGVGAIGAWYFAIIAAASDQYLVALIAFLTVGSLLGFIPWNFPNAKAFLGDSGSHLVGYLLAILAILPHFYTTHHPQRWAVLTPLLVLALPLGDLVQVVVVRWRIGQPFYVGDNNHLSHQLVRAGLTRTRAVLLIWAMAATAGAVTAFF